MVLLAHAKKTLDKYCDALNKRITYRNEMKNVQKKYELIVI